MKFRFFQTSAGDYVSEIHDDDNEYIKQQREKILKHKSVKFSKNGHAEVEINSIEELTKFIKKECGDGEIIVGYNESVGGWYIEDYDDYRE